MRDFAKIFFSLCLLVVVFLFGRSYGEKTFRESEEFKNIVHAKEDCGFAKSDFENIKAKLQNITDSAETKKTDELLGQILQVFLADLGLRIENRNAILKQAEKTDSVCAVAVATQKPAPEPTKPPAPPSVQPQKQKDNSDWTKEKINRMKSVEWLLLNSAGGREITQNLKKLQIRDLNGFLKIGEEQTSCPEFLGAYRGQVTDISGKYFGSFVFELKKAQVEGKDENYGKMSWIYNSVNQNQFSQEIRNHCGRKVKDLAGRVFNLSTDRYVQLYKLIGPGQIAGNLYEVLPNGTTKTIGSFNLKRVDSF